MKRGVAVGAVVVLVALIHPNVPPAGLPPMTTVNFGTTEQETAVTILAPSLAIPLASTSAPTMKPLMF
jgi:hypothetical protein